MKSIKVSKLIRPLILLGIITLLASCGPKEEQSLKIALSKGSPIDSYKNYYDWLKKQDTNVIVLDLYAMPLDSAMIIFEDCSALVITGGTDINPGIYGKAGDTSRCWTTDPHRDSLELALFKASRVSKKPVLGICRGEQMINVALGGSLIIDIPEDFDTNINHQCEDPQTCFHRVTVESNSLLHEITDEYGGEVNSNHHQGIERLARELKAVSYAPDGLIEAVEWAYPEGNPFLLAVQWHPERLEIENPLSGRILERFLEEARKYDNSHSEVSH